MWNGYFGRRKIHGCIGVFLISILLSSCASKPRFEGYGDLCGMVIDENNRPVKNFIVYYSREPAVHKSAVTNESGIFVFHSVPSGKSVLSGKKCNYTKLARTDYQFYRRSDIICFQVSSIKAAVEDVEALASRGETESALKLLNNIVCERKTDEWKLIKAYRLFLKEASKDKDSLEEIIND